MKVFLILFSLFLIHKAEARDFTFNSTHTACEDLNFSDETNYCKELAHQLYEEQVYACKDFGDFSSDVKRCLKMVAKRGTSAYDIRECKEESFTSDQWECLSQSSGSSSEGPYCARYPENDEQDLCYQLENQLKIGVTKECLYFSDRSSDRKFCLSSAYGYDLNADIIYNCGRHRRSSDKRQCLENSSN